MPYRVFIFILWLMISEFTYAQNALKIAFSEGIKATVKVLEYEKAHHIDSIPRGYCAAITGKTDTLKLWEQIKLESLALFLEYNPSLLAIESSQGVDKNILCLLTSESKAQALASLNQFKLKYPKLDNYLTKIEVLPSVGLYRVIPGVGYNKPLNDIMVASKRTYELPNQSSEIHYESSTVKVIGSEVPKVNFLVHTSTQGAY